MTKSVLDPIETKKMVRMKLSIAESDDFLIETNTLKVSLICPLMKFRIHIPARARNCAHVQCFDLEPYLLMNEKKPGWFCPVCDRPAPYDQLVVDGLFRAILNETKDCEEVEFTPDGEWTKVTVVDEKMDRKKKTKVDIPLNSEEICCDLEETDNPSSTAARNGSDSDGANSSTMPTSLFNGHSSKPFSILHFQIYIFIQNFYTDNIHL